MATWHNPDGEGADLPMVMAQSPEQQPPTSNGDGRWARTLR
jgi:hypothetical protein